MGQCIIIQIPTIKNAILWFKDNIGGCKCESGKRRNVQGYSGKVWYAQRIIRKENGGIFERERFGNNKYMVWKKYSNLTHLI